MVNPKPHKTVRPKEMEQSTVNWPREDPAENGQTPCNNTIMRVT